MPCGCGCSGAATVAEVPASQGEARTVAALLGAGALARLVWLGLNPRGLAVIGNESEKVAAALAAGRGYADAFGAGSGPTAHLAPLTPLPTAAAFALFGTGTPAAMLALSLFSLAVILTGLWLVWRAFVALDSPVPARLAAVAIVALVPLQFGLEMREFRSWEAGIAATGLAAILLAVLRLDARPTLATRPLLLLGLGNGLLALLNPAAGLGASGLIGLLLLRRVGWRRWAIPVGAAALVIAAVLVPWAIRNDRVLGAPVLLRTGLGLSLTTVYNDGQLSKDRRSAYYDRMLSIHPNANAAALARYKAVGEVEYNRQMAAEAQAFMAAHPDVVRRIRLQNLRDYYLPPPWLFERFQTASRGVALRAGLAGLAGIAGLTTLAVLLWRRRWIYLYPAAAVLLPCLPYILSYPLLRYRYLVSSALIFLACDGAVRLWRWFRARSSA